MLYRGRIAFDNCIRRVQDGYACSLGYELKLLCGLREEIIDED